MSEHPSEPASLRASEAIEVFQRADHRHGGRLRLLWAALAATSVAITGCGGDDGDGTAEQITLVVYDSWPDGESGLQDALDAFTTDTGVAVEVLRSQDAGTMVSKAALTAGNPEGDVMFGVDNTFLSRVTEADVFEPYEAEGAGDIPDEFTDLAPDGVVTPVDYGDVCVNADLDWFAEQDLDPPTDLAALADPAYRDLLVVENPASSSPGLAFLMATVAEFGEDGWSDYWTSLRDNGVAVVDGWTEAYYERFTRASGDRPLVVSYGSSPPVEVIFATEPVDAAPTAAITATCFRQVEFAGVLRGTDAPDEARELVDFLVSPTFQRELALNLFVYPTNSTVELPAEFTDYSVVPDDPYTLDPTTIAEGRDAWIETWTDTVLR